MLCSIMLYSVLYKTTIFVIINKSNIYTNLNDYGNDNFNDFMVNIYLLR